MQVTRLAVLDVLTIADAWERANKDFAVGYWPWSLLAQAEPLPENLLSAAPEAVVDNALRSWGTPAEAFDAETRKAYVDALRDPYASMPSVRSIARRRRSFARTIPPTATLADASAARCSCCGAARAARQLVRGLRRTVRAVAGWANDVSGAPFDGGHFFPEEMPAQTADALLRFFPA